SKLNKSDDHKDKKMQKLKRLKRFIYKNYFLFDYYKLKVHSFQLYELINMKLEQNFTNIEDDSEQRFGVQTFTVSSNDQLWAFSCGIKSIEIYLLENGLKVYKKSFGDFEILFFKFIEKDEKLLVILKDFFTTER